MYSCHLQIGVVLRPSVSPALSLAFPGCVGACRKNVRSQCRDDLEVRGVGWINHSHQKSVTHDCKIHTGLRQSYTQHTA